MSNKIILTGELALKFGSEIPFHGNNVRDALRCIAANRPGFHKYLIDCEECGIGFHIETEDQDIESPYDCILPIVRGDIIITPTPAGSKSGGAKILTAALIAAVLFIPTGGTSSTSLFAKLGAKAAAEGASFAASAAYVGAQAALTLAVNLAITGIQQLMAPDPAVDQQDEGYLFNGSEQNIVEGLPVPLLYGELRVPGYPVSFETLPRDRVIESIESTPTGDGFATTSTSSTRSAQNNDDNEGRDYEDGGSNSNSTTRIAKDQTAVFTDIISEGPIYGLVDGGSSIYFNDDPIQTDGQSSTRLSLTGVNFSFTNGSPIVTIDKNGYTKNIELDSEGTKYLVVRNYDSENATAVLDTNTGTSKEIKITADNAFFTDASLYDPNNRAAVPIIRLVNSASETVFEGYLISRDSSTVGYCSPVVPNSLNPAFSSGDSYTVIVDGKLQISSISGDQSSLTLSSNFSAAEGTYKCDITSSTFSGFSLQDNLTISSKYKGSFFQFRNGTLSQPPFLNVDGTGPTSQAIGPGPSFSATELVKTASTDDVDSPSETFTGTSADGFGLSAAQAQEVDEVRLFITYPQIWNRSENGIQNPATVVYTHSLELSRDGSTWESPISLGTITHYEESNAAIVKEVIVNLQGEGPFEDFRVTITRITNSDQAYNSNDLEPNPDYTTVSSSSITSLSSIIKENLSYPLTAMAKVRLNASEFSSIPRRTYHCKGLKVKVPSNYITRDENDGIEALYTRNISSGAIESSYQDWDGNFRAEKVYTNNPAWIFYDILTNDRYGLGGWIEDSEIDKYSLYRIARYCDELVPNGSGGFEPRFTTNVYLTRETDAYKILKDLASSFRSMLYWMDGEIYPVIDQESDPVYNFSKGNVIDGLFSYESSGSKTRANQVVVSWNNPDANYRLQTVLLEDRENIVKTGRIIREKAAAFGCTSEAQAIRYGRWKLWTSVNQTEIVSFRTSINANFLAPGNIINIQDADRYPANVIYSGRISKTGTLNATTIPLDREIELVAGSSYELSVLIEKPGTFLAQSSATINSVSYTSGDLILTDSSGADITSEIDASNLLDDSGDPVQVSWKPYTRVETLPVITSSGTEISSLTVSSPGFSQSPNAETVYPNAETVWALTEILDDVEVQGSTKSYKILAISEESSNIYAITAVEHYNEKYAAIEADTFTLQTEDPVFPTPKVGDIIPPPRNVYSYASDLDSSGLNNDVTVFWDPPISTSDASSLYQFVDFYEIEHTVPGYENLYRVPKGVHSISAKDFPPGTYTMGIRTIARGKKSVLVKTTFVVENPARQAIPRKFSMPLGGVSTSPVFISAAGEFYFENSTYSFSPIGNPQLIKEFDGTPVTERIQDCSDIASQDFSSFTEREAEFASHYIMFDSSSADPLTLIKAYEDEDLGYTYFYDAGTGNTSYTSNWTSLTGTLSVAINSNTVTGSGTSFTTELQVGDLIKFSSTQAARVAYISSDTSAKLDKNFSSAISGVSASRSVFRFDRDSDCVFASVRNDNGTFKYFPINFSINPDLNSSARLVTFEAAPNLLNFDGNETLTTSYTNLILTATSEGYNNPEFKITGTGFSNSEISQTEETTFSDPTSGTSYIKTLDKVSTFSTTDLDFTVTVRDKLDPNNTQKQRVANITIPFIKDGLDGADGVDGSAGVNARAVNLTVEDQAFTYDTSGSNPSPSSTTVTATAVNTSGTVYYEFFKNDVSVQNTTTATYSYTPQSSFSSMPDKIEVQIREGSSSGTILARDQITLSGIKPGADGADGLDGTDGVDAITTFYSNQAHTVPVTNTGIETWTGSGGTLNIYDGTTELILNSNTQTTSYPTTNGRFNLNITKVSGNTLTEPTITGSGSVGATIGNFSGNLTQATQYEISIYVKASDGTQYNPKFNISISPSFEGADGADGTSFFGASPPSGEGEVEGSIWFDSDDGFKIYRYQGDPLDWVNIQDEDIGLALAEAAEALGEMVIYIQSSAPTTTGRITGDIWIDNTTYSPPSVPYSYSMLYRWDGTAWIAASTDLIGRAHIDALNGQDLADAAQTTADGKIVSFAQTTPPTADGAGDFWIDTDDNNKLYRWSGTAWVEYEQPGNLANASGTLDDIADGSTFFKADLNELTGASRAFNALDASSDYKRTIQTSTIAVAGTNPSSGVVIDNSGLRGYNSGSLEFNISTTGNVEFGGDIDTDGQIRGRGNTSATGGYSTAIWGESTTSGRVGVLGTSSNIASGVVGYNHSGSGSTSGYVGVNGFSDNGVGGSFRSGNSSSYGLYVGNNAGDNAIFMQKPNIAGDVRFLDDVDIDLTLNVDGTATFGSTVNVTSGDLNLTGSNDLTVDKCAFFCTDETSADSSVTIGNASRSGKNTLIIREGSAPGRPDGQISIYGHSDAGETTLGLVTERDTVPTSISTYTSGSLSALAVYINDTKYYIVLSSTT